MEKNNTIKFVSYVLKNKVSIEELTENYDKTEKVANTFLELLEEIEQTVIKSRYGLTDGKLKSLKELSDSLKMPINDIVNIEDKALKKLRHQSKTKIALEILKN